MTRVAWSSLLLAPAWFAAVNLLASFVARGVAAVILRAPLAARSEVSFALRVMPATVATLFVTAMFLPAHWRFEPGDVNESFGLVVWALAAAGVALIARSALRLSRVAIAGWRLRACAALPRVTASGARDEHVYEVDGLAGVLLAGVLRPRILIGRSVRKALTSAELTVAIAHERAHVRARDNLKRLAIYCAPDCFGGSRAARRLEEQWRAAVEWTADARAVAGERPRAIALASALVKVAQLAGERTAPVSSPAWSTLHDAALLDSRVRRLITGDPPRAQRNAPPGSRLLALAAATAAAGLAGAHGIHRITELLIGLLP